MVLVDTSVLIDFFKGEENKQTKKFIRIIEQNIPFGITPFTYLEILQGARNEKEFHLLEEYLTTQQFYYLKDEKDSYTKAAKNRLKCTKKGITVRSSVDLLIIQTALEHKLSILHNDKDFQNIGTVVSVDFF